MKLPDIQDQQDQRGISLAVGVAGVRYPVTFDDAETTSQGVAEFEVTVGLPAERRGTHMSRMIEIVHDQLRILDPVRLPQALKHAVSQLDVEMVGVKVTLPIAFAVVAPESQLKSYEACNLTIEGHHDAGRTEVVTALTASVMSLCPCSKAISDYGAHNQRSQVTLSVTGDGDNSYPLPVRAAFDLIRGVGSSPVYPLLKRIDERTVTMDAHDRPRFVEDMARDLSLACRALGVGHQIVVLNMESIHSHDAIAAVSWDAK